MPEYSSAALVCLRQPLSEPYRSALATHAQAWTLLLLGPFLDRYISHGWVFNYDWNVPALTFLTLSCACAVGVNVSQFMCLGRFSAVSYQVSFHGQMLRMPPNCCVGPH